MPLYSYRCQSCRHEFETLVRASDVPACPSCHSPDLERLVSRPAQPGTSGEILKNARTAAAAAGHFSNYARSERPRR